MYLFFTGFAKKRKPGRQSDVKVPQMSVFDPAGIGAGNNSIITLDPSMFRGVMPIQLSVLDNGGLGTNEAALGQQVLQGLEGLQLQVTGEFVGCLHEFHETCPSVTFYFMKISFSDISRKWILPNMIGVVNRLHSNGTSQFTPKMKANAKPRLLSSLV